jgi:hypothetical protein
MASIKLEVGAISTVLSTDLNTLASGSSAVTGTALDNGTDLYPWADWELFIDTQGSNRSASPRVDMYFEPIPDGTNAATSTNTNAFAGTFIPSASATTAQRLVLPRVPIPGYSYHVRLVNQTGQAFAASGNTLKMRPVRLQTV